MGLNRDPVVTISITDILSVIVIGSTTAFFIFTTLASAPIVLTRIYSSANVSSPDPYRPPLLLRRLHRLRPPQAYARRAFPTITMDSWQSWYTHQHHRLMLPLHGLGIHVLPSYASSRCGGLQLERSDLRCRQYLLPGLLHAQRAASVRGSCRACPQRHVRCTSGLSNLRKKLV